MVNGKGGTILVVEDDAGVARLEQKELERAGYRVVLAETAEQAMIRLKNEAVDLIVLDYFLPGEVTGLRLYKQIQDAGHVQPVIIVTGSSNESIVVWALRAGVRDFVTKSPAFLNYIPETVERVLKAVRTERQLADSEERFRNAFDHTHVPMVLTDLDNRFLRVNDAFAQMFGYSNEEILKLSMQDITHPDDVAASLARRESLLAGDASCFQIEKRYRHKKGHVLWGLTNVSLVRDAQGRPQQYVGQVQDLTERKKLEEQFRQSQKMEAIGQLAGGVAHDFNNLLTIISGYSEVVMASPSADESLKGLVKEIWKAGDRAAALTRQLLAFSRKQIVEFKILDLNNIITDMEKMLRRLIGEDVSLAVAPDPRLSQIKADPGQLEQVLLNLVVNARDAMPRGGKLTVETANIELDKQYAALHPEATPGRYALLAVSDTGCGMTDEVKARIFEPFFTTKEAGRGTGLGLATTYGIVKQAGGHIWVYSEVGRGTTFKVYFPAMEEKIPLSRSLSGIPAAQKGNETILLVEDEDAVRALTAHSLRTLGYAVLEASRGAEAIRLANEHGDDIHLITTDVVMPDMGGREVVDELLRKRPGTKVLFISGYTNDAVVRHGVLSGDVGFLQKPFTPSILAAKVRAVLDQEPADMLGQTCGF